MRTESEEFLEDYERLDRIQSVDLTDVQDGIRFEVKMLNERT